MIMREVTSRGESNIHMKEPKVGRPGGTQWWRCWEFYLILIAACFLRFYSLRETTFEYDQMQLYYMSRNAIVHGLLLATSNIASIGMNNPPATNYVLLIPAFFSASPLAGAVFTAILATIGVLLFYAFTRHHYGRVVAGVATLLYAVGSWPVYYSRFIWNPNFLPIPIVILLWLLYRGAVSHKNFWFFPSVMMVALVAQFHPTSIILVAPVVAALLLAPRSTVRWYEYLLCFPGVYILYSTYLVRIFEANFIDITYLLHASRSSGFRLTALPFYQALVGPLGAPYLSPSSIFYRYRVLPSALILWSFTLLLIVGALLALYLILRPQARTVSQPESQHTGIAMWMRGLWQWWLGLRASPLRCGLVILLVWQIVPLLYEMRSSSVRMHEHYFIFFMPSIYIFIGFFVDYFIKWLQKFSWGRICSLMSYGVLALLILGMTVTTFLYEIDATYGHFVAVSWTNTNDYYDDYNSMQRALQGADQFAMQENYHLLIINAAEIKWQGMDYLAQSLRTPTMVTVDHCALLPAPSQGPALLLMGPYSTTMGQLTVNMAHARFIKDFPRLGGPPYKLYALPASPSASASAETLSLPTQAPYVKLLSTASYNGQIAARYQLLGSGTRGFHVEHLYTFTRVSATGVAPALKKNEPDKSCHLSNYQSGMQLLVPLGKGKPQQTIYEQASISEVTPDDASVSLFGKTIPLSTFAINTSTPVLLHNAQGKTILKVKVTR